MLDLKGVSLDRDERLQLQNPQVGGVILFSRNIQSRDQICDLVAEIRACSKSLLVAVDQEGGRVQRLREGFTAIPSMQAIGNLIARSPEEGLGLSKDLGWLMASEVIACGLDLSFAPVLDVDRDTSSIIGDRSFSDQPEIVISAAEAFIKGMHDAGMAATGKHFPGHGGIVADSHLEAPVDDRSWNTLYARDIQPFAKLSKMLDAVMPAHITFPSVDPDSVGFSSFWLNDVLRGKLGFEGIIFSDDLTMKGADIAGGYVDKAKLALKAGCDMILVCNCPQGAVEVLSYMESANISQSSKLASMVAKRSISWSDLEGSPRRLAISQKVAALN
ncbi:MAG: beta-N-acetylhexosaminidase [Pseudomonadales bacterium]|jgi:beta-N-acetylhexosaminidase|nr:beta-N-acetylhexosaminidase [SAR92 clade bacterium]|tara:strand:- start:433 stop:1425 length:993 start_codon:yes stop_codon:yes gene_type:complete